MKAEAPQVRRGPITIENLLKLPLYFVRGIKYHAAGRIYTPKPLYVTLSVTSRCNSRCVMCSYWQSQDNDDELTPSEFGEIFRNPLFGSLERFALSGGEPTLRNDLAQIAQAILDSCPQIKKMSLLTNGLEPTAVTQRVEELLAVCKRKGVSTFSVSVSLDGYGATHQRIRRVPQAFERTSETIKRLKKLQHETPFYLSSTCVVQPLNIGNLAQVSVFGQEQELPITFSPVCLSDFLVKDTASKTALTFSDKHLSELKMLFEHKLQPNLMPSNVPFWREYFSIIGGERRKLPCFMLYHYASMGSDGTLRMCAADNSLVYGNALDEPADKIWYSQKARELRKRVEKYFCPKCTICCNTPFSFTHEFFYYAGFLLKEKSRKLLWK